MNIVNLRDKPGLLDIPNQLRQLANAIECGEQPADCCMTVIISPDKFDPDFYGWGKLPDRYGIAGIFTLVAKMALTDKEI